MNDEHVPWSDSQKAAIEAELRQQAIQDLLAGEYARTMHSRQANLPEDFEEINHLAGLVDLHPVFGQPVIAVHKASFAALKEALDKAEDQEIVKVQLLPDDIPSVVHPKFLGWAFNRPPATEWPKGPEEYDPCKPVLLDPRPASERTDRDATWNPLENIADAADFINLYGIAYDPRHTVRYVLGLRCPPKRPFKTWRAERVVHKAKDVEEAFDLPEGCLSDAGAGPDLPTEHSPEPWKVCKAGGPPWANRVILDAAEGTVAFLQHFSGRDVEADARHIVACVNASAGVRLEATEREQFTCDLCGTHGLPSIHFPGERGICTACANKRREAEKQDQTTEEKPPQ